VRARPTYSKSVYTNYIPEMFHFYGSLMESISLHKTAGVLSYSEVIASQYSEIRMSVSVVTEMIVCVVSSLLSILTELSGTVS